MCISPLMDGNPLIDKPLRITASYLRGRGRVKQIVAGCYSEAQPNQGIAPVGRKTRATGPFGLLRRILESMAAGERRSQHQDDHPKEEVEPAHPRCQLH